MTARAPTSPSAAPAPSYEPWPDESNTSTPRSTTTTECFKELIDEAAPQLIAERGIGYVTAAAFYIAWSHPGRCHLNRGGDRQLNRALYHVAITKQRCDPATKAYIARRTAEGKGEREAIRCVKRFIARRVWRLLEHPPVTT